MTPNNTLLDKYREESLLLYPLSQMDRENGIRREAHIRARLLSSEAIERAISEGMEIQGSEMSVIEMQKRIERYLSTHIPPLIELTALLTQVYDDAYDNGLTDGTNVTQEQYEKYKQQYISEKINSLLK